MENSEQPLLSTRDEDQTPGQPHNPILANTSLFSSHNANYGNDIDPINGVGDFFREFFVESKKLWRLAGPAIFSSLCRYSLGAVTQVFAGHLSALDLAAFAIENSVIVWHGECAGDAVWSSLRCSTARYAGNLLAEVMGYPYYNIPTTTELPLHLCGANTETYRSDRGDLKSSRDFCAVDDSAAVRLCNVLSYN